MTLYYGMDCEVFHKIYDMFEKKKGRDVASAAVDRWLSFRYGLISLGEENFFQTLGLCNHDGDDPAPEYLYKITDQQKLTAFILAWV